MPKISQYTVVEPQGEDKIIITQTIGSPEDATKNITIDDLKEYINQGGGGGNGVASLNTLTGNVNLIAGANVIISNDLNDTLIISVPNIQTVSLQNALDNGNSWTSGDTFQTYTFNKVIGNGKLSYTNSDEGWGWSIDAEEGFFFTDENGASSFKSGITPSYVLIGNGSYEGYIQSTNITSNRTIQFPDNSRTIALLSDITSDIDAWMTYSGTRTGGDLLVQIGDYERDSGFTELIVDDANRIVRVVAQGGLVVGFDNTGVRSNLFTNRLSFTTGDDITQGTNTNVTTNSLIQSGASFITDVQVGDTVFNTTETIWTTSIVTVVVSNTQLTLSSNIFTEIGDSYQIYRNLYSGEILAPNFTGNRTFNLPDESGTIALTSNLSSLSSDQEIADFNATIDQVGVMVDVNSATDVVVTVRDFATEAIPVGSVLTYRQAGVGKISNAYSVATGDTSTTYREGDVLTLWQKTQDNWVVINPPHAIDSQTTGEPTGSDQVFNVVSLTQAEYNAAVGSHNADTLYVITS